MFIDFFLVEQLQKQLREETELSLNKDNILQQNVNKNNSLAVPSTSKETSQKKKQIGPSKEKYDAKKVNKKRIGDVSLKENCEIAFDKLMVNQPHTTFNRKGTKRVYINKKKKPKVEYNILEFDNHENKTAVLQWLNDTRNKFDRLSQTQNVTTEDTCEIPVIDLASISQVKGTEDKSKPMVTKVRRGRAKSLNIEVKKVVPTQKKQHLEATSVSLENYDIDDNTEEEEVVKKAEEKVIFDLIEDEFLDTLDDELQCAKDEFEVKSKRYMRSKKGKPLSPTSTTGWERLTKIKKTIKKNEKVPKQLNITLQSVDEPKNDKPSRCKKKTNTVKTTDADVSKRILNIALVQSNFTKRTNIILQKQDDDLKEETVTRNEAMDFEKSNSLENQVCKSRIILNRSESSASDKKVDTIKTIGIDVSKRLLTIKLTQFNFNIGAKNIKLQKQNGDSKQSIIREEKVDVQNESRPPEDEIRTKSVSVFVTDLESPIFFYRKK